VNKGGIWIGNWIYWVFTAAPTNDSNSSRINAVCNSMWQALSPLPPHQPSINGLVPETVPVPQPQHISTSQLLTLDWISIRHSKRPFIHELNRSSNWLYDSQVSQSASMSWCRAPLWALPPDITSCRNVAAWKLRSCFCGASWRVCNLQCSHSMVRIAQNT
jgi:hypothetical protein